jgi:hypothetical protein
MKKVRILGIIVTNRMNFANSCPPQARSRYLPPNQTTAEDIASETMLFSISALVRKVHGNLMDCVGIRTKYGIAQSGEVSQIDGAVADCSFVGVLDDQERKRRKALSKERERSVRRSARVRGGRFIRGGIFTMLLLGCQGVHVSESVKG